MQLDLRCNRIAEGVKHKPGWGRTTVTAKSLLMHLVKMQLHLLGLTTELTHTQRPQTCCWHGAFSGAHRREGGSKGRGRVCLSTVFVAAAGKSLQGDGGEGRGAWGLAGGWGQVLCRQDVPWTPKSQGSSEHEPQWPRKLPAALQGTGPLRAPAAPWQEGGEVACLLTALPEANSLLLEESHGKSKH